MELVVRTPYGDADVDLVAHEDTARLLDLVQEVTGQAAPRVIRVDGRTLPAEVAVTDAGLVVGSVVDTTAGADSPPTGSRRRLVQLTDHGTGVERELVDGRYRVGPGRRLHAGELERAPVVRSLTFAAIGLVAAIWALGSLLAG